MLELVMREQCDIAWSSPVADDAGTLTKLLWLMLAAWPCT
jgi:hypothetical protein